MENHGGEVPLNGEIAVATTVVAFENCIVGVAAFVADVLGGSAHGFVLEGAGLTKSVVI